VPITPAQFAAAEAIQNAAAQDQAAQLRLVAGTATGKSQAIEASLKWLITQGVDPEAIHAVPLTRASVLDLRLRIPAYATAVGY